MNYKIILFSIILFSLSNQLRGNISTISIDSSFNNDAEIFPL